MEYLLKNGNKVIIREVEEKDAESMLNILIKSSKETKFLSRNSNEFNNISFAIEKEIDIIRRIKESNCEYWYAVEYNGEVVGQCSVKYVRNSERFYHRTEVGFMLLEKACNIGIGGKMMLHCLEQSKKMNALQVELSVIENNERALKMYKGFGFKEVGRIPSELRYLDGSFADGLRMVKYLDKE